MNQDYWDELYRKLEEMSDEEFMELLIESGIERCPFAIEEDGDEIRSNPM